MPDQAPAQGTRRKKVPTWYYAAGVGGLLVLYYLYTRSKASSAASSAATTPVAGGTAAGSYGNAGDLAALAPYLANQQASQASNSGATYVPPTGQVLNGSGYQQAQGQTSVTSASGQSVFAPVQNLQQANAISGGNGSYTGLYTQVQPGIFVPANAQSFGSGPVFSLVSGTGQ